MRTHQAAPFNPDDNWHEPDMTIWKPERPPAPIMSDDSLSAVFGPWADWLKIAAKAKGAPADYVTLALLSVASAAIGNSRWPSPWQGWQEPPVLWSMLVGDPSSGKSPGIDAIIDQVKIIERDLSEAYTSQHKEWVAADELASLSRAQWKTDAKTALADGKDAPAKPASADAGERPIRERICIADATTEKVAELLAASWRGLLMSRDELAGWIGSMDRYNGGGDRPFWLEAYGGRSYTVDRKSSPEPIVVDHLTCAVLGGTQPAKLERLLVKTDDDGMLARFLTVFPEPAPLSRPDVQINEAKLRSALEQLRSLRPATDENGARRPFYLPFTNDAADTLQEFRKQCREWEADARGVFKGHIGKLPGHVVRIACVLAHLDWASGSGAECPAGIEITHVARACHLVGDHLRPHAFRAYGAADAPPEIIHARKLADIILRERPSSFTVRDIQRRELGGLMTAKPIAFALEVLEQADWLRLDRVKTVGRPRKVYTVNPRLWEVGL